MSRSDDVAAARPSRARSSVASSSSITCSRKWARRASESRSGTAAKVSGDAAGTRPGGPAAWPRHPHSRTSSRARSLRSTARQRARCRPWPRRTDLPSRARRAPRGRPLALVQGIQLLRRHLVEAVRVRDDGGAERGAGRLATAGMLFRELQEHATRRAVVIVISREVGQQVQCLRRAESAGQRLATRRNCVSPSAARPSRTMERAMR